jgi:hypothetical protein
LGDFDTVAGSPAEVKATWEAMTALGVDAFFCALPGHADPESTIRAMRTSPAARGDQLAFASRLMPNSSRSRLRSASLGSMASWPAGRHR